ncbi:MAG: helix-turn-helix domain-containing protein [Burkholderiaceae bacterium]|nr:helix-turn-helix domain-containing protein [Burkholderiaceae bacterium]
MPVYCLYGEDSQWPVPDLIHVESIAARSRLHNWEIRPHRHHGLLQLLWLQRGRARLQLDGDEGMLEVGELLLIPQHCVHGFRFSRQAAGLVVTVAYPLLARIGGQLEATVSGMLRPLQRSLAGIASHVPVGVLLAALEREYGSQAEGRGALLEAMTAALLIWLLRESEPVGEAAETARGHRYLARFSAEVERNYARHLPLQHYAGRLGISAAHLNALCRRHAQCSALEMIHARLMLEARRSLAYTSMSVRDIAESLGFGDPAYFTRFFRQRSGGIAPRDFRQRAASMATERETLPS